MFINSLGLLEEVLMDKKGSALDILFNYLFKKFVFGKLFYCIIDIFFINSIKCWYLKSYFLRYFF